MATKVAVACAPTIRSWPNDYTHHALEWASSRALLHYQWRLRRY